jgi:hypothetical protein
MGGSGGKNPPFSMMPKRMGHPMLVAMRQWGERFLFAPGEPHPELVERLSCKGLEKIRVRDVDGRELGVADLGLVGAA